MKKKLFFLIALPTVVLLGHQEQQQRKKLPFPETPKSFQGGIEEVGHRRPGYIQKLGDFRMSEVLEKPEMQNLLLSSG